MPTGAHPLSIGTHVMACGMSGRLYVNLGGIAEVKRFCPICGTKAFFVSEIHLLPKLINWRRTK